MANSETVFIDNAKPIKICGQDVLVRNPKFKSVLQLAKDARPLLNKLMNMPLDAEGQKDTLGTILDLAADEETWSTLCLCASACTNKEAKFFEDIELSEVSILIQEMVDKVDWRSLKELFRKAIPSLNLKAQ